MNEETGVYYLAYYHTQYEFMIAEALQQICSEEYNSYMFDDMMLHKVIIGDAMRSFGVRKVINHIRELLLTTRNYKSVLISSSKDIQMEALEIWIFRSVLS